MMRSCGPSKKLASKRSYYVNGGANSVTLSGILLEPFHSGDSFKVAYQLGAEYPFESDELALLQFDLYLSLIHGSQRRNKTVDSRWSKVESIMTVLAVSTFVAQPMLPYMI
eukprot:gene655-480_t